MPAERVRGKGSARAAGLMSAALAPVLAAAALVPAGASAAKCADEFTGASGGSWSVAANWSAGVPKAGTSVCWAPAKSVVVDTAGARAGSVAAGGSLQVTGGGSLTLESGGALGSIETRASGQLLVEGTLACTTALAEGGAIEDDGSLVCPVTVAPGGRLSGSGQIQGSLTSNGSLAPGSAGGWVLSITGDFGQGPGGALSVGAGRLIVGGAVHLAGTLTIGYGPLTASRARFLAIQSGPPEGRFARVTGTTSEPWAIDYGPEGVEAQLVWHAVLVAPTVQGIPAVGSPLTCAPGPWSPQGTLTYRWLRAGAPITGALGASYTPVTADIGNQLSCAVTVSAELSAPASPSSFTFSAAPSAFVTGPTRLGAAITGSAVAGGLLSCRPRWVTTPHATFTYAWLRNRVPIPGATASTYAPTPGDEDQVIGCMLTAHWGAYARSVRRSVMISTLAAWCAASAPGAATITLIGARVGGRRVLLSGAARPGLRSYSVLIATTGYARRPVRLEDVHVTIPASGLFTASVPLPRHAQSSRVRYVAAARLERYLGGTSAPIALTRLLKVGAERPVAGGLEVTVGIDPGVRGGTISVERLETCTARTPVAAISLAGGDLADVVLEAPTGRPYALYRIIATVGRRSESTEIVVAAPQQPSA